MKMEMKEIVRNNFALFSKRAKEAGWRVSIGYEDEKGIRTYSYHKEDSIIEITYDINDPEWYGWAAGILSKAYVPNWMASGNDPVNEFEHLEEML